MQKQNLLFLLIIFCLKITAQNPATFTVQTDKIGADVSSNMWGIFFEDINLGADGGMYAELIKNRSFEFTKPMMGWTIRRDKNSGELIIKIVNTLGKAQSAEVKLEGNVKPNTFARLIVLQNDNLEAVNSLDNPSVVVPTDQAMDIKGKTIALILAPYSFSILKFKVQ